MKDKVISRSIEEISRGNKDWNAIVIGAGPSGALAALQIAKHHDNVLLIDKATFPRYKVCGCCLNIAALDALQEVGLGSLAKAIGAINLDAIYLYDGVERSRIPLLGGVSVSRSLFDSSLINAAVSQGVDFLQGHTAAVLLADAEHVAVKISSGINELSLHAKVVIIADGLSGRSLDLLPEFAVSVLPGSRFGAGVVLPSAAPFFEPGGIYMCCNDDAYVGLVALEDGKLDIAAAFDRAYSRKNEGPAESAREIILSAGLPLPEGFSQANWTGTNSLTRRRKTLAGQRIFVVGDSCGYAEPFTGEGIAWAMWSAIAASRIACKSINEWNPSFVCEWNSAHARLFNHRHFRSSIIARSLRNTTIRRTAAALLSNLPDLARPILSQISGRSMKKDFLERVEQAS